MYGLELDRFAISALRWRVPTLLLSADSDSKSIDSPRPRQTLWLPSPQSKAPQKQFRGSLQTRPRGVSDPLWDVGGQPPVIHEKSRISIEQSCLARRRANPCRGIIARTSRRRLPIEQPPNRPLPAGRRSRSHIRSGFTVATARVRKCSFLNTELRNRTSFCFFSC